MKSRHVPLRTCISCKSVFAKGELIRIVRSPEGEIKLDLNSSEPGRGCYICRKPECVLKAINKKKLIEYALGKSLPEKVANQLKELI